MYVSISIHGITPLSDIRRGFEATSSGFVRILKLLEQIL